MVQDAREMPKTRAPSLACSRFRKIAPLAFMAAALFVAGRCFADITLPALISDNMVLQQRTRMNVWGRADPGESVTVQLGAESAQTLAGKDGSWGVKLDGIRSGGPYDMTISGKNSIAIHNVAIGEVWVCAGESNMEYKVLAAQNAREEMAEADLPMVRAFIVKHAAEPTPAAACDGVWVVCDPDAVKDFSAVGYFFARELNRRLRTPVGMIQSTWGPSPIEAWMPRQTLEKDPALSVALQRYEAATAAYPDALKSYQARMAAWEDAAAAAKAAATAGATASPIPPRPVQPLAPGEAREPAALFNGMISPMTSYAIRGVLWYQGESNTSDPALYAKMFPAMITAWRGAWEEGNFPFFFTQLSGFLMRRAEPGESHWAELREAQAGALSLPKTGMVVSADTGEERQMHPADKQDIGHRLALLAEKEVYDQQDVTDSGPLFSGMQIKGGQAVVSFTHTGGGLVAKGGTLKGFAIAGDDGHFVWADAKIDGDKVIVQSAQVPSPAAVRYAWADFPDCDLFSKAGLPAAPFRTDGQAAPAGSIPAATPPKKRKHQAG